MTGIEMKEWRKRNRYTQDMLREALDLGSRQTIISLEKSEAHIPRMFELALLALENIPESREVDGRRYTVSEQRSVREHVYGSVK